MDSYVLSNLILKLFLIGLGCILVLRGKGLKEKQAGKENLLSPSAMIVIGLLIVILNVLQILWLLFGYT